jgi:hypothetical protein
MAQCMRSISLLITTTNQGGRQWRDGSRQVSRQTARCRAKTSQKVEPNHLRGNPRQVDFAAAAAHLVPFHRKISVWATSDEVPQPDVHE